MANQQRAAARQPQQRAYAADRQRRPQRSAEAQRYSQTRPESGRRTGKQKTSPGNYQQKRNGRNQRMDSGAGTSYNSRRPADGNAAARNAAPRNARTAGGAPRNVRVSGNASQDMRMSGNMPRNTRMTGRRVQKNLPPDQALRVKSSPGVRVKAAEGNFRGRPVYEDGSGRAGQTAENTGKKKVRRFYDYSLLFTVIFLTVFGLVMIYSSSSYSAQIQFNGDSAYFTRRQAIIALGGFVVMMIISKMDYHFFAKFALLGYGFSYIFLLMVMLTPLGVEANGKKRWLALGPVQFQPTEMVKIALILLLAVMITQMGKKVNNIKGLLVLAAITVPIAGLVAMNNLSSGIIIVGIAFVMAFVASELKWPFALCVAAAGVIYAFAGPIATVLEKIGLVQPYQLNRIHVWLQPEAYPQDGGYQVLQGLYAIGSGGLVGKGLGESIQKLGFIPEAQNDMVFSVICEELGLFGAVSVILIFLFMIYRFMVIASNAPDLFGAMLVVGVMGHIAIQVILNIAVVTNTIPNTGITLPFISYGGTSVMFLMMEMGMVLSVSNQVKIRT